MGELGKGCELKILFRQSQGERWGDLFSPVDLLIETKTSFCEIKGIK